MICNVVLLIEVFKSSNIMALLTVEVLEARSVTWDPPKKRNPLHSPDHLSDCLAKPTKEKKNITLQNHKANIQYLQ